MIVSSRPGSFRFTLILIGLSLGNCAPPGTACRGADVSCNPIAMVLFSVRTVGKIPRFLYVGNNTPQNITGYRIDPDAGTVTALSGGSWATPVIPFVFGTDSRSKWLYYGSGATLGGYSIDSSTGNLTSIPGSPFTFGGTNVSSIVLDASETRVFVAENVVSGAIYSYSINPTTGALSPTGNNLTSGQNTTSLIVSSAGFLYAANGGASASVSFHPVTAGVAQAGTLTATANATQMLATQGNYLYSPESGSNVMRIFSLSPTTGAILTNNTTAICNPGDAPRQTAIDGSGRYMYVNLQSASGIAGFSINANTGGISPISVTGFTPTGTPLTTEPLGKYVFQVNNGSSGGVMYGINSGGTLTSRSTFSTGNFPVAVTAVSYEGYLD